MNFLKYPKGESLKKKKKHKMETTSQSNQEKTGTNKMEIDPLKCSRERKKKFKDSLS